MVLLETGCQKLFITRKGRLVYRLRARIALVPRGSTRRHSSHAGTGQGLQPSRSSNVPWGNRSMWQGSGRCRGCPGSLGVGTESRSPIIHDNFPAERMGSKNAKEELPAMYKSISNAPEEALGEACAFIVCMGFEQSEFRAISSIGRHWLLLRRGALAATASSSINGDNDMLRRQDPCPRRHKLLFIGC